MTITEAYEILEISSSATLEEILDAYHNKAKQYHPDLNHSQDATRMMQLVNEAFELICASSEVDTTSQDEKTESTDTASDAYEEQEETQPEPSYESSFDDNIFYKVVIDLRDTISIPKFCPVCMRRTEEKIERNLMYNEYRQISSKKYTQTTYSYTMPFYCCCKKDFNKYVKYHRDDEYYATFYFKNKSYATFFAEINNTECEPIDRSQQIKENLKDGAVDILSNPGCAQAIGIGLLFAFIFFCVKCCG